MFYLDANHKFFFCFKLNLIICLVSVYEGQILTEGKKALYHCNYCNKDISGRIRIKCVVCSDFDLCVECFSVGAEVQPHKSNHLYRVMVSDFILLNFHQNVGLLQLMFKKNVGILQLRTSLELFYSYLHLTEHK